MIGRRLRGVLGLSVVWAGVWAATGTVLVLTGMPHVLSHLREHPRIVLGLIRIVLRDAVPAFALWGAASGALFATLLAIAERRRTFDRLRGLRVAMWGAAAGAASPLLAWQFGSPHLLLQFPRAVGVSAGVAAVLGAATALATVEVARRHRGASRNAAAQGDRSDADPQVEESHRSTGWRAAVP